MRRILTFLGCLVLTGCAMMNPYEKFYFDNTKGKDVRQFAYLAEPNSEPQVIRGTTPDEDNLRMAEDGYVLIGYSSFSAAAVNENKAISVPSKFVSISY